jgi:hypothetical protein
VIMFWKRSGAKSSPKKEAKNTTMDRRTFKNDTEKFVRTALANSCEQKPSEPQIRKAVNEIVRAFKPVVLPHEKRLQVKRNRGAV